MLFSESKKFVFIAVPKTGSTSIEKEMVRLDPEILRNKMVFPDGSIREVHKHISLREVQKILGDRVGEYRFFAFTRDPVDHTLSRYFFYANGRARQRYESRSIRKERILTLGARVWFARLLPRPLWFLLYPLRQQVAYVSDRGGRPALDFCGQVDSLGSDLSHMLKVAGYHDPKHEVPHLNSATRSPMGALEKRFIELVLRCRLRDDFAYYRAVTDRQTS